MFWCRYCSSVRRSKFEMTILITSPVSVSRHHLIPVRYGILEWFGLIQYLLQYCTSSSGLCHRLAINYTILLILSETIRSVPFYHFVILLNSNLNIFGPGGWSYSCAILFSGILMESRKLVSGILMESLKLVTLSLTLLKRILCPRNDYPVLARFHSHWTRQLVEFPRSITIVPPRFNSL
jgi:hypothetical protein